MMKIKEKNIKQKHTTFLDLKPGDIFEIVGSYFGSQYLVVLANDELRSVSLPEFALQTVNPDVDADLILIKSKLTLYK